MGWWEDFLQWLLPKPTAFPISRGKISGDELWRMLNALFPGVPHYISDAQFDLVSKDDAKAYLATLKKQPYLAEGHDCDNFSFAALGYFSNGLWSCVFGMAWSRTHAFNYLVDENKVIWIVEPQTNSFMTIAEAAKSDVYLPWLWSVN